MAEISILFESLLPSAEGTANFYASEFDAVLSANSLSDVPALLREVQKAAEQDFYAFGFFTYESGYAFLPGMFSARPTNLPLAWFGLTKNPRVQSFSTRTEVAHQIRDLQLNQNLADYSRALAKIRAYIERGDTYQVNYTLRYRGDFAGSVSSLYQELKKKQHVSYAACIETPQWSVISLSPELFFRRKGGYIFMRPMKGTSARGRTVQEDQQRAQELRDSAKERAENLMIVDMLRNDLGKICLTGSVEVTRAFEVERYETLLQMTSTIEGKLGEDAGLPEIFGATFPSGSITGAPKIRTMQIIRELEPEPRGIYTGAIGYVHRDEAVFSVAIRTVLIDHATNRLELGVGSGVLHEANAEREYQECQLKANFLTVPSIDFQLIETMLWVPGKGFRNFRYHMDRLLDSANYFSFPIDLREIEKRVQEDSRLLQRKEPAKLRLLTSKYGEITIEISDIETIPDLPVKIRFASDHQNSTNAFIFHKTTNRSFYEKEFAIARKEGCFDVIFTNERNEVTEGAISNIFIKSGRTYYTPAVSCGLLAGTYRRQILERRPFPVEERILSQVDVRKADSIFLTNAIRGMIPAILI
jgi:para-aminobenzoate synthetase / 4-amino-4-deoxychorismate lyase